MGEYGISQPVPRTEDPRLLKGAGRFIDDIKLLGMVHGHVLRSPHAHAIIKSIDTSAAKAAPGVLDVLTGEDYKAAGLGNMPPPMPPVKNSEGVKAFGTPRGALITGKVRFVGDLVAFVVAETPAQARDGAELIDVDYEPIPSNTNTGGARGEATPAIWEERPDNLCLIHEEGDKAATDAAFVKADYIHRQHFQINRVLANTMEPRGCVADYDAKEDFCTV
ncbi:MAG: molybdopterin-dependent oxidoreductase, partial [Rhodospirillales bacterium]|nr:molybdopterin-dependent oxidoreductase [Rhodospirillales bacterium]